MKVFWLKLSRSQSDVEKFILMVKDSHLMGDPNGFTSHLQVVKPALLTDS